MGSSPKGNSSAPDIPAPAPNQVAAPGTTQPIQHTWQSFLPNDPNAMATGLTPDMLGPAPGAMPVTAPGQAGAAPGGGYAPMLAALQSRSKALDDQLRLNTGVGRGGSLYDVSPELSALIGQAQDVRAPVAGAGGRVAQGDLDAYMAAQRNQQGLMQRIRQQALKDNMSRRDHAARSGN